jgi:hypothetical protein
MELVDIRSIKRARSQTEERDTSTGKKLVSRERQSGVSVLANMQKSVKDLVQYLDPKSRPEGIKSVQRQAQEKIQEEDSLDTNQMLDMIERIRQEPSLADTYLSLKSQVLREQ